LLFSQLVHSLLLGFGLIAIPVTGFLLSRRIAGAAIFLWLIPVALTASVADLVLEGLDRVRPGLGYNASPGGSMRFAFACFVMLPPVEVFYQRIVTCLAGGGLHTKEPGDWGEDATPTESDDDG
jgi:hypothetical protein